MKTKILIGELSSYKAIVICKYIKLNYPNVFIFTFDTSGYSKFFHTKFSDVHFVIDRKSFYEEIKWIIKENEIDHFFPVINSTLTTFLSYKKDYGRSLDYMSNLSDYTMLNDKYSLFKLSVEEGILMPQHYLSVKDAEIPFVVKPTNRSGARGVKYVRSKKDIEKINGTTDQIIQQYVEGVGVGYSFYCKNGEIITATGHRRLAEYPVTGGPSTYRENYYDERFRKIANKIIQKRNYTGFVMLEFKLTKDNELYLLEANPRIWGSINQGLVNGVNYFEGIIGKTELVKQYSRRNKATYISPLIYLSILMNLLRFRFSLLFLFIKNMNRNVVDVSLLKDTKAYLSTIFHRTLS